TTDAAYVTDPAGAGDKTTIVMTGSIEPPTRSIIPLTEEQIARVASSYVPIEETSVLQLGEVRAVLEAGQFLAPWQQFALNLINQVIDERRSEEHTSELQSRENLVCRLLL